VGTIVRLYLGWRLLRLIRRLLAAGMIAAMVLALHVGPGHVNSSAARTLQTARADCACLVSRRSRVRIPLAPSEMYVQCGLFGPGSSRRFFFVSD
jgi:hypothetical protein